MWFGRTFSFGLSEDTRRKLESVYRVLSEELGPLTKGQLGKAMISIVWYVCNFKRETLKQIIEEMRRAGITIA